jgi:hypothetical protein
MRFFGEGRRGALAPVEKPRDAEAMDSGVAAHTDDQAVKRRAEAGTKLKPETPEEIKRSR